MKKVYSRAAGGSGARQKRGFLAVAAAFLILLSASACAFDGRDKAPETAADSGSGAENASFPYSFSDSEGTLVTLKEKPKTVAILFSSLADIWESAGGKTDVTVYETVERGFAGSDAVIVDAGSGHSSIDLETLTASELDLVIGTADYESQRKAVDFCRSAGIPAALFRVESFEDYLGVLKVFCAINEAPDNYKKYGSDVADRIGRILSSLDEKKPSEKKILFIRAGSSAKSTKAKTTDDNFVCLMLDQLGTVNIADSESTLTGTLSLEVIVKENPDYLFITTMGDESAATEYMNSLLLSEGWRELDCVKSGDYCFLPKSLFHFKPNSRWAEAYEYLAEILYE